MIGASGRRQCSDVLPSSDAANFTGAGLVSENSASCSGTSRFWIAIASLTRPSCQASCIAAHSRGATFAVTLMQPSPPAARNAIAVWSSPDNWQKSSPQERLVCSGRARFAVASFTPTMFLCLASRAIVSTLMSTTERGGML